MILFVIALLGGGCRLHPAPAADGPSPPGEERGGGTTVRELAEARGEIVCLLEEMERRHGLPVAPVHDHLLGFRGERGELYTILSTSTSAFLFSDSRFRGRTLVLAGRSFPPSGLLEVTRADWIKDGQVHEVYYWCEVCSIKGVDPGRCACCQAPVELRERPRQGGKESKVPDRTAPAPDGGSLSAEPAPRGRETRQGQGRASP